MSTTVDEELLSEARLANPVRTTPLSLAPDFCESGSTSELHSDLQVEFAAAGLTLATTWGAALGSVTRHA